MASQTKPFAQCSIVDLAHEISLAASASPSGSALDSAAAQLLLPSLRNADLVEAVLQRHPRVQSSEGLICFATPASKQAWCEMLRDLFQSAGVAVSDAACLRVYLVLKECAKRGRVTLAPARSSHLLHDHFLGKNVCVSFALEERTSIALPLQLILTAMLLHEQRQHHLHPAPALRPLLKFTQKGYGCAQAARGMFAWVAAAALGLVTPASPNIFVLSRSTRQCEHSIVARVLVGYFFKVKRTEADFSAAAAARIAGKPGIIDAAASGDVKLVEDHCIADPACVHQPDGNKWTALHFAACHGHVGVIQVLLSAGAQVNIANKDGFTALHFAAAEGQKLKSTPKTRLDGLRYSALLIMDMSRSFQFF